MKFTLSILVATLITFPCFGQIEWVGEHEWPEEIKTFHVSGQGHHIINFTHHTSGFAFPPALKKVLAIDGQGGEIFRLSDYLWTGANIVDVSGIVELNDSSIVFPTILFGVDGSGTGNFSYLVAKFDKNLDIPEWCQYGVPAADIGPKGKAVADNGFILYSPDFSYAERLEGACQGVWDVGVDFQIYDLAITGEDHLVWAGNGGLTVMDADGNIATVYPDFLFEKIQTTSFNGIVGLRQDSLFVLSSDFVLLQTHHFPDDNILGYSVRFGKVAVLTENRFVHVFNDSLVFQNSFELLDENEFQLVDIGPEGLAFAGLETYGSAMPSGGTEAFFIKSYSFSGNNYDMSRDVGVVDVELGEITGVVTKPNYLEIYFGPTTVTVENFGSQPVNGLFIRSKGLYNSFSKKIEDVILPPNETLTLTLDSLWLQTNVQPGSIQEVCIWTSHPDYRLDENSANDGFCTDYLVGNEEISSQNRFMLYPNPTSDWLNIYWQGQIPLNNSSCRIFNTEGRIMKQIEIDLQQGIVSISVKGWPSGVYFIQIFNDDGASHSEKFLVVK